MESIHILVGIDGQKGGDGIPAGGQGQLDEDAIHPLVLIELVDGVEQMGRGVLCGKMSAKRSNAQPLTGPLFATHVSRTGGILSNPQHCQSRWPPHLGYPSLHLGGHLRLQAGG
jgi:hypothetical protein